MSALKVFWGKWAIDILLVLLGLALVFGTIQTVRIEGFHVGAFGHQVTLLKGLKERAQDGEEAKKLLDQSEAARNREGLQAGKSYGAQAKACRDTTRKARASGAMIEEVTHVEDDPDSGPDGGIIGAGQLRIALGQDPDPARPVSGRGHGPDASGAQGPGGSGSSEAPHRGPIRRAWEFLVGRR